MDSWRDRWVQVGPYAWKAKPPMDDIAAKLRAISERVSRNVPHRRDPERFHVEKSCICQDLEHLADQMTERQDRKLVINRSHRAVTAQQVFRK